MNVMQTGKETVKETQRRRSDMKLEVVVIAVQDVGRAKKFYGDLGWRLDADFAAGDSFRVVQFTPPGSPASIHFGIGVTSAAPGFAKVIYLIVTDIEAARPNSSAGVPRIQVRSAHFRRARHHLEGLKICRQAFIVQFKSMTEFGTG